MTKWAWSAALLLAAGTSGGEIDFDTEIIPVLTRAGCNAGSCHGAAAGRGGFHLSLLGGDPAADYDTIVHAFEGRRVNLARPAESLILAKPTGQLDHEGGDVLEEQGAGARKLAAWIAAGAPRAQRRRLSQLTVAPQGLVVEQLGTSVPLSAQATFDNGEVEDVTAWTVFTSSDPGAVAWDPAAGKATLLRRGQHVVIARYLDRVIPLRLTLPLADRPVDLRNEPRRNLVDEEILRTLETLRIPVSPPAGDEAFLRRVTLDLTGRLPTPEAVESFLSDRQEDKRVRLVDQLLDSEPFVEFWSFRLAGLLRIQPQPNDREGARVYQEWLRQQLRQRVSWRETTRALLTTLGDSHAHGAANFSRTSPDPRAHAELVSQVFLGVRLQCANCHNHPLDRWTQDDYHGLAAIFARLERGRVVTLASRGAVTNPRTGEPAIPRLPGSRDLAESGDPRTAFADWLAAPDNPLLAKAAVNRAWKALFGRGLVEPTDDLRDTNPATHPDLLDRLARDFIDHNYDWRHTLKLLATSATYGRSSTTQPGNAADDRFFSHAYRRPLEPEVLADAIADVTGVWDVYGSEPEGTRAVTLYDPRTPSTALDVLGRCSRQASCEGETVSGGLATRLHQLNGELINRKLTAPSGRLQLSLAAGSSGTEIVREFYWRALGRLPTTAEARTWEAAWSEAAGDTARRELAEDFVWSLLNCTEFTTNH